MDFLNGIRFSLYCSLNASGVVQSVNLCPHRRSDSSPTPAMADNAFDAAFDRLMHSVGYSGPFQRRFNILFNCAMVVFASFLYNSMIFTFAMPDHWCHVPGQADTQMTDAQWKHATVPR